jgi:hypothetical protein
MTTDRSYQGILRVLDRNGSLLDLGPGGATVTDPTLGAWSGWVEVTAGSCLAGKSLTVLVEFAGGGRALAEVGPRRRPTGPDRVRLALTGIDRAPY